MKNAWRKLSAIFLAMIMVLAMVMPAMAEPTAIKGDKPATGDKHTVTIDGLSKGDVVQFIQIVDATYDDGGFIGYVINDKHKNKSLTTEQTGGTEAVTYPSAEDITALANDTDNIKFDGTAAESQSATVADGNTSVSEELGAGEWMVLVTSANPETIYNPMVVSVYYTDNGKKIDGGSVNAGNSFKLDTDADPAYVKKTTLTHEKEITGNTDDDVQNKKGDDLSVGDIVNFKVTTTIPSYSEDYEEVTFEISDTMDEGLTLQQDAIAIKLNNADLAANNGETKQYEITGKTTQGFTIKFDSNYIKSLAAKTDAERTVTVEYSAKLNDKAKMNVDANVNTSKVKYSNDPKDITKFNEKDDHTYQYTFELDGQITGSTKSSTEGYKRKGHELIKVNEGHTPEKAGQIQWDDWEKDESKTSYMESTVETGLGGATFQLTEKLNAKGVAITNPKSYTATTDDNGYFNGFKGLDAGVYTLEETAAPAGYSLNAQKYTVKISADYNEDGTLKSYSVKIWAGTETDETKVDAKDITNTTYTVSKYTKDKGTTTQYVEVISSAENPTFIKNTKLNNLPSTGGMGTYLFTFIGVLLMVLGAVAFRGSKKNAA